MATSAAGTLEEYLAEPPPDTPAMLIAHSKRLGR
jgi:hypothetical protein